MAVSDIMAAPARLFRAAVGASIPDPNTVPFGGDWGVGWTEIGDSLTPITLMRDIEFYDIEVEQSIVSLGRRATKEKVVLETTLAESNAATLGMAFASTATSVSAGASQKGYTEINTGGSTAVAEWQFGIEGLIVDKFGESTPFRVFIHEATATLGGNLEFSKKGATGVPLRIESIDDPSKAAGAKLIKIQRINDYEWTGATWAIDANGRAYNVPELSANLFANGTFAADASWTKGTGWIIASGVATATAAAANSNLTQAVAVVGAWYRSAFDVTAYTSGGVSSRYGSTTNIGATRNAIGSYVDTGRQSSTTAAGFRSTAAGTSASIDNAAVQSMTLPTLMRTVIASQTNATVAVRVASMLAGTDVGAIANLDSATNPQNFIIAFHDGSTIYLDKCVAGVYTTLITVASTFVADALIEIRRPSGNTFQLWYNGAQVGTNQTISDASIISNLRYGLFSTDGNNKISSATIGGLVVPLG